MIIVNVTAHNCTHSHEALLHLAQNSQPLKTTTLSFSTSFHSFLFDTQRHKEEPESESGPRLSICARDGKFPV